MRKNGAKFEVPLIINGNFKTQLITGILSSPIIYIPHYHYNYVDSALAEIIPERPKEGIVPKERNLLGLYRDSIYEHDLSRGRVDFATKVALKERGKDTRTLLKDIVHRNEYNSESYTNDIPDALDDCKIFLMKNVVSEYAESESSSQLLWNSSLQLLLQTFAEKYERREYDERTTIIIVSPVPVSMLPAELLDLITVINILPPSIKEIEQSVKDIIMSEQFKMKQDTLIPDLCRTLQGLDFYNIEQILRSVLIRTGGRLTENSKILALEEKKQIVKKNGVIEVVDSDVSFADVGGLDILQNDMMKKAVVFKHLSRATDKDVNITLPKGILIVGMPGCGKSMIAKSIANEFGVSLLRLDISNLMGQYVGQSEENLRKALLLAEAAHPCVLWIDEIEKAFHGANNSNSNENDTLVMRMMGYFLTWMQERKTAVYIVATANDIMRPEFMRKGRFDEVYFVDFPNKAERKAIFEKKIARFHNTSEHPTIFDFSNVLDSVSEITDIMVADKTVDGHNGGFSGSEIDCVVNTVVENQFVEYVRAVDNQEPIVLPIALKKTDFETVIKDMKKHVMSGQISNKNDKNRNTTDIDLTSTTQIENIYKMNKTYNFKPASK